LSSTRFDSRRPYWSPSAELQRKAEAKAIAVSLFQPGGNTQRFFVESPQKVFAHLLSYLPAPTDLVHWMSHPEEIDKRVRNTELSALIDPKAPQQRTGVLGSLNMVADSFRLLPTEAEGNGTWTATKWAEKRQGWMFITSRRGIARGTASAHQLVARHSRFATSDRAASEPAARVVRHRWASQSAATATASYGHHREQKIE